MELSKSQKFLLWRMQSGFSLTWEHSEDNICILAKDNATYLTNIKTIQALTNRGLLVESKTDITESEFQLTPEGKTTIIKW